MENENTENETPKNEVVETTETPTEVVEETPETSSNNEEIEELKKQAELAKNYKIRAERAEKKLKETSKSSMEVKSEVNLSGYSLQDLRALQGVHDDDVEKIVKWAKNEGITIAEAKKDPIMKTYLKEREEERATSEATSVKNKQRGVHKTSGDEILHRVEKGEILESDEEIELLARARFEAKKNKK
jgi:hypothetical protein